MNVYIEYVLIDNFILDALLLVATHLTLRKKLIWWRIILASVIGAVLVLLTALVSGWLSYIVKIVSLLLICFVANGFKGIIKHILLFVAYTALLGGLIIAVFYLLQIRIDVGIVITYFNGVPFSLYVLAICLFVMVVFMTVKYLRVTRRHSAYICEVNIAWQDNYFGDKKAFLDSGNSLTCEGLPVCFVLSPLDKQLRQAIANAILLRQAISVKYSTMSGQVSTMAIKGVVHYKGNAVDVLFALPSGKRYANYDILLNNKFLEVDDETTTVTKTHFG